MIANLTPHPFSYHSKLDTFFCFHIFDTVHTLPEPFPTAKRMHHSAPVG